MLDKHPSVPHAHYSRTAQSSIQNTHNQQLKNALKRQLMTTYAISHIPLTDFIMRLLCFFMQSCIHFGKLQNILVTLTILKWILNYMMRVCLTPFHLISQFKIIIS